MFLPWIPWCYLLLLGNSWYGFCHWINYKFRIPFDHYSWFLFAIWYGTLSLCYKKSLLSKQWLSSLIIVLEFMVFISHCVWLISCLVGKIRQSLMRKLNTKLITSAARHPQIDGLIERVDETTQIYLRCSSYGSAFWLGTSSTHGWYLLQYFNQRDFNTFELSYEYRPAD